jgi:hypothetical protein
MKNSANSTIIKLTIVALLLAGISGCASRQIRTQMPVVPEKVAVETKFLKLGLLGPFGGYEIEGCSIITRIETQEKIRRVPSGGLLGAIAEHAQLSGAAKKIVEEYEPVMKYDLVSEVDAIVKAEVKNFHTHTILDASLTPAGNNVMELKPWVYLSACADGTTGRVTGRVGVYLRAFLKDKGGSEIWRGGYNYQSSTVRPFEGSEGWFADNGRPLKSTIRDGYRRVARVMLKDSLGAKAGWSSEEVTLLIDKLPGAEKPREIDAVILKRTEKEIFYTPKTGKASFIYGVNVVPKEDITIFSK